MAYFDGADRAGDLRHGEEISGVNGLLQDDRALQDEPCLVPRELREQLADLDAFGEPHSGPVLHPLPNFVGWPVGLAEGEAGERGDDTLDKRRIAIRWRRHRTVSQAAFGEKAPPGGDAFGRGAFVFSRERILTTTKDMTTREMM